MTKTQAQRILGISGSVSPRSAKRIYSEKCQKVRRGMVPGNTLHKRQKAEDQLLELTMAWRVLNTKPARRGRSPTPNRTGNGSRPAPQPRVASQVEDLAGAWEGLFDVIPLPAPVVVFLLIAVFLIVVLSLSL